MDADETETEVVEGEQEQAAEELAEAAGVDPVLISNDLARAIFDARRDVVRCGVDLTSAQEVVKLRKASLSQAQTRVMDLICEAEKGQMRLFDRGDPDTVMDCKGCGAVLSAAQAEAVEDGAVQLCDECKAKEPNTGETAKCDECGEETSLFDLGETAQGQLVCQTCFEVIRDSALTEHGHQE